MASPTSTNLQALSRLDRAVPGQGLEPMKSLRRSYPLPAIFSKAGTIRGGTLRPDSRSARDRSAGPAQSAIAARQCELAGAGSLQYDWTAPPCRGTASGGRPLDTLWDTSLQVRHL